MSYDTQAQQSNFRTYTSHRRVRAAKIKCVYSTSAVGVEPDGVTIFYDNAGKPKPQPGWYVVFYEDGYISFCPPEQFELGYIEDKEHPLDRMFAEGTDRYRLNKDTPPPVERKTDQSEGDLQ